MRSHIIREVHGGVEVRIMTEMMRNFERERMRYGGMDWLEAFSNICGLNRKSRAERYGRAFGWLT